MGPEVTKADLEAFVRARLGQNAQCLKRVMSFSKSFEIFFSEEEEPDNLVRLDDQLLRGHKCPMWVALIPFALTVTEVFDFVAKKLVQEERDRLWSRAIQPNQPAPAAPTPKQGYQTPLTHKKVREFKVDPKSRGNREGATKTKERSRGPKISANT